MNIAEFASFGTEGANHLKLSKDIISGSIHWGSSQSPAPAKSAQNH